MMAKFATSLLAKPSRRQVSTTVAWYESYGFNHKSSSSKPSTKMHAAPWQGVAFFESGHTEQNTFFKAFLKARLSFFNMPF